MTLVSGSMDQLNPAKTNSVLRNPSFSVLLCVNKTNPYLARAIQSVLTQTDGDFEFLISANACSDELMGELEKIIDGDPRVRLFRTSIGQLAFNLNFLADKARGDYLVRMDADDESKPDRIEVLRRSLREHPVDVLGSWVHLIDERSERIGELKLPTGHQEIVKRLPYGTVFIHPAVAIKREFLLAMRGYLGGFVSEDTDLWLRARRLGGTFRNIPNFLLSYRLHPGQSIRSRQGYAEVAGHWLRELLVMPSWYATKGFFVSTVKCLLSPLLNAFRAKRYAMTTSRVS